MKRRTHVRRGFALLVVLWVMVGIGILALGANLTGRSALATAHNRTALTAARWKAEGCIERVRAAAHEALTSVPSDAVIAVWDSLDRVLATSPYVTSTTCTITSQSSGSTLDINNVDPVRLQRFFTALNIPPSRADSLIDALLDWRDPDTIPRPLGAERAWYAAANRLPPRDADFANSREILRVRGFERFVDTVALLGVETNRLALSHASLPVLASLPGFTPEALARAADLRLRRERLPELLALSATLPKDARDALIANYAELARRTTPEPERWVITTTATSGTPEVAVRIEVQLARAGTRVAILRRR